MRIFLREGLDRANQLEMVRESSSFGATDLPPDRLSGETPWMKSS
jgi:hypothetical protein